MKKSGKQLETGPEPELEGERAQCRGEPDETVLQLRRPGTLPESAAARAKAKEDGKEKK